MSSRIFHYFASIPNYALIGILPLTCIYLQLSFPPILFYPLRSQHLFFCPSFLNASLNPIPQFLTIFQQHLVPYQALFCFLSISPYPFTPQILTTSLSPIQIFLSPLFLTPTNALQNIMVTFHSLELQSPISSLTESNSILHFIFHALIFPQSCLFYHGNGSSKTGGSSNMLGSFYETKWCQILEDITNFMENSHNENVRTKQIRQNLQNLPTHSELYTFLFTNN